VQGDRTSLGRACAESRQYKNFVWKLATEWIAGKHFIQKHSCKTGSKHSQLLIT
jgi:hypothetical protein